MAPKGRGWRHWELVGGCAGAPPDLAAGGPPVDGDAREKQGPPLPPVDVEESLGRRGRLREWMGERGRRPTRGSGGRWSGRQPAEEARVTVGLAGGGGERERQSARERELRPHALNPCTAPEYMAPRLAPRSVAPISAPCILAPRYRPRQRHQDAMLCTARHIGAKICGAEMCYLGAMSPGIDPRVQR